MYLNLVNGTDELFYAVYTAVVIRGHEIYLNFCYYLLTIIGIPHTLYCYAHPPHRTKQKTRRADAADVPAIATGC